MPKFSSKQKYRKDWEDFPDLKGWLIPNSLDQGARCKVCRQDLNPHLNDLRKHATTKKHQVLHI